METYKFIADETELKWFWDYGIPPLKKNEIYFVSLSARNKQLDEEERRYYHCGRSEMFNKQQIRHDDWNIFLQHIKRFEVRKDAFLTKSGVPYPEKALVVYWNICPIDAYKAMKDQMNYLTEVMTALTDSALKNSKDALEDCFYKVRKSFDTTQSLFARNFGEKTWIDFDIDDIIEGEQYGQIREYFHAMFGKGNTIFVKTGGGMHCLVRRSEYKINPDIVIDGIKKILPNAKEITRNSNEMCPLIGTLQYGRPVIVMNKEDFGPEHILRQVNIL